MYRFKIQLGDPSRDGHGYSEDFLIECNLPIDDVRRAFFKAEEETKIIWQNICEEYEDYTIRKNVIHKFKECGLYRVIEEYKYVDSIVIDEDESVDIKGCFDLYCQLLLEFIKIGNPGFVYKIVSDDCQTLEGDTDGKMLSYGGYGLWMD